jgi:ABC-type polysaccharide/polyol phosphate export permease
VVFPLEILPLTAMVAALIQNLFGVGALLVVLVALGQPLHMTTLLLPLVLIPQLLFTLGLSYLMAVAGTYLPDIRETLRAVIRGTFFITPILWPAGRVPEDWSFLVDYNPLAVLVNAYRDLIINGELPGLESALWFSLFAAALFVAGLFVFNRVKHNFADLL